MHTESILYAKKLQTFYPPFFNIFLISISTFYLIISLNIQNGGPKLKKKTKKSPIFIKNLVKNFSTASCCINFGENRSSLNIQNGGPKYEKTGKAGVNTH